MDFGFKSQVYNHYTHLVNNELVAIERNRAKLIGKTFKKFKKAEAIPDEMTVKGHKFILDEEYQSLKIDFSTEEVFKIKDLIKANLE